MYSEILVQPKQHFWLHLQEPKQNIFWRYMNPLLQGLLLAML